MTMVVPTEFYLTNSDLKSNCLKPMKHHFYNEVSCVEKYSYCPFSIEYYRTI